MTGNGSGMKPPTDGAVADEPPEEEYEVGYGKPPKKNQFQKGQSGNPKGRLKNSKNFATDLREESAERVLVREGEGSRKISKQRAAVKSLFAKALGGNVSAMKAVIELMTKYSSAEPESEHLSADDLAIVEAFLQRRRKPKAGPESA
ncbi:MAG: DUF5681 domain-containing protein [Proteobacteria bacterium]|nr:DUF5681 domain-containing protein [Pseudomonadota bacterium]